MRSNLSSIILKCFDSGLEALGPVSSRLVYGYLAQRHLTREEIPDNPVPFLEALRQLFGQGSGILETVILRDLKLAFNLTLGNDLLEVLELVKHKDLAYDTKRITARTERKDALRT